MGTKFVEVYNRFFGKITDDMYLELTPEDTFKDVRALLLDSITGFEFPRKNLNDYVIKGNLESFSNNGQNYLENNFKNEYFLLIDSSVSSKEPLGGIVDESYFNSDLSDEEINILALLMQSAWLNRQVVSIENTRMKYSGSDFKFTSQANHLQKLINLLHETQRQSFHMQRLYKRRKTDKDGLIHSNWSILRENSALDYQV